MAIKFLIDSASDVSREEAKELGAEVISMYINFGTDEYMDGVDLTPSEFYEKLATSTVLPQTTQITPYRWEEKLNEMQSNGDEVIVITMSSKLSGTYESAKSVAEKRNGVYVVDSFSVAAGERILLEYAVGLSKQGLSAKEIVQKVEENKSRVKIIAVVNTLEYLKKGGRISTAVAFAGTLLSIKPVVGIVDGEVKVLGKAKGSKKSNNLLNTLIEECGIDLDLPVCALWSGLDKSNLETYIEDSADIWQGKLDKVPSRIIGCTIGTHVGPGALGVAFFASK